MKTAHSFTHVFLIWLPDGQFPICFRPLVEDIVGGLTTEESYEAEERLGRGRISDHFDPEFYRALARLRNAETVPTRWIEPHPYYCMLPPHGGKIGEVLMCDGRPIDVVLRVTARGRPNRLLIEEFGIDIEIPASIINFPELGDYLASRHRGAAAWKLGSIVDRVIGFLFRANVRLGIDR
jgi:hypothetical protein